MHRHGIICIGAAHRDRTARIDGDAVLRASNPVSVRSTTGGVALNIARNSNPSVLAKGLRMALAALSV